MGFDILSIVILLLSLAGIIIIILRHLPDAVALDKASEPSETVLREKGLPAQNPWKVKTFLVFWLKRLWNFLLEAKDLKPGQKVGYKLKKILQKNKKSESTEIIIPPPRKPDESAVKNEDYFLEKIKKDPKNLDNFKDLGNYYLDNKLFQEARDVFVYLTKHLPGDAGVYGKLAYILFYVKEYSEAIANYEKSLSLDSTQPNRYYNLGLCYEAVGKLDQARLAISKALNLEPENLKYKDTLARVNKQKEK